MLISGVAHAQYCPGKIAAVEGDVLTEEVIPILNQIYKKLGCTLAIKYLPGKRGLSYFNNNLVDGETFRFSIIEKKYTKLFVRSSTPMLNLTNALWEHPDKAVSKKMPIAHVLGIMWQDKYVAETPSDKLKTFYSQQEITAAYRRGTVGSFLASKQSLNISSKNQDMTPPPLLKKTISSLPLFHYLNTKYAKFMGDFSEELRLNNPFAVLE